MKVSKDVRRDIQLAQDTLNEALHSPDIDRALVYVSAVAELMDLLSKSICKFHQEATQRLADAIEGDRARR